MKRCFFKGVVPVVAVFMAIAAFVTVIGVLISGCSHADITSGDPVEIQFLKVENRWYCYSSTGNVIEFDNCSDFQYLLSGSGKTAVIFLREKDSTGKLYCYDGKKLAVIDDNLTEDFCFDRVKMGYNGSKVYFRKHSEDEYYYVYSAGKVKKSVKADCIELISPDGNTLSYTRPSDPDDHAEFVTYYFTGNKEYKLGFDITVYAIADGAKYIYFGDGDGINDNLYVQRGTNENNRVKLSSTFRYIGYDISGYLMLNRDLSQAIFKSGDDCYISVDGKEPHLVASDNIIIPLVSFYSEYDATTIPYICSARDFSGTPFSLSDKDASRTNICYFSDKYELIKSGEYIPYVNFVFGSPDGKTVYYVMKNTLMKLNLTGMEEKTMVVEENGVDDFLGSTNDGLVFYLVNGEVYSQKDLNGRVKVADAPEYHRYYQGYAYYHGFKDRVYTVADGKLVYSAGDRFDTVEELSDVLFIDVTELILSVGTKDGYYFTADGDNFIKIADK